MSKKRLNQLLARLIGVNFRTLQSPSGRNGVAVAE
jgi:hypothetical protein